MTQYYTTVIPIYNAELSPTASFEFSGGLWLSALPVWVAGQEILNRLSLDDRNAVEEVTHAFVLTYPAHALGSPDPDWKGPNAKSIQETKYEIGLMANLALWLAKASPACFAIILHARHEDNEPIIQRIERHSELLCHPNDAEARIKDAELPLAAVLHNGLIGVTRDTSLWTAIKATWAGLQMNNETVRCLLFWVALEALFGPEDAREITYRLSQRVGFFLGANREDARQLFETAKAGYHFRSKIVHGRWKEDPNSTVRMAEAESLCRRAFARILEEQACIETFSSKRRETFLDGLVFNGATAAIPSVACYEAKGRSADAIASEYATGERTMGVIKVKVLTMEGEEREIETPADLKVGEFIKELASALYLPLTDSEGRPVVWCVDDKNTGRTLDLAYTLNENGVLEGHRLSLIRATVAGGPGPEELPPYLKAFEEGLKSFYDLFKHITTISTGSIVLIITFLERLFTNPAWKGLMTASFAFLTLSVVASLTAMFFLSRAIALLGKTPKRAQPFFDGSMIVTITSFLLGIICLVVFAIKNLYR